MLKLSDNSWYTKISSAVLGGDIIYHPGGIYLSNQNPSTPSLVVHCVDENVTMSVWYHNILGYSIAFVIRTQLIYMVQIQCIKPVYCVYDRHNYSFYFPSTG